MKNLQHLIVSNPNTLGGEPVFKGTRVPVKILLRTWKDALISGDKNIPFQQGFLKYPIPVRVFDAPDHTYATLQSFVPKIEAAILAGLSPGPNLIVQ